jgi:predicted DNA-binding transcriptional regulator AlpA
MPQHHLDRRAHKLIQADDGPDDELLKPSAVCDWLGVSSHWLAIGRSKGYGPPFRRLSSQVIRYPRRDVKAWLASRIHRSTAEYTREDAA